MTAESVLLLGGPYDRQTVRLSNTPKRIEISGLIYERIDDPDTGNGLGAYAITRKDSF